LFAVALAIDHRRERIPSGTITYTDECTYWYLYLWNMYRYILFTCGKQCTKNFCGQGLPRHYTQMLSGPYRLGREICTILWYKGYTTILNVAGMTLVSCYVCTWCGMNWYNPLWVLSTPPILEHRPTPWTPANVYGYRRLSHIKYSN
jgi:hypothetical protein